MVNKDNLNETLADAVMDRPREFFIGECRFCLWYPTLGMSMMVARHIESLEIDGKLFTINPNIEALRLSTKKRKEVCYIISIHTFRKFHELCNSEKIRKRAEYFERKLGEEDIAQLLLLILSIPTVENIMELTGIAEQQRQQAKILKIKNDDSSTLSFGGLTMYGSLIVPACEKLNLTPHQVIWEISIINLRMLLADTVNTIYLSDEERKKVGPIKNMKQKDVYGMTKEDIAKLKSMDWT